MPNVRSRLKWQSRTWRRVRIGIGLFNRDMYGARGNWFSGLKYDSFIRSCGDTLGPGAGISKQLLMHTNLKKESKKERIYQRWTLGWNTLDWKNRINSEGAFGRRVDIEKWVKICINLQNKLKDHDNRMGNAMGGIRESPHRSQRNLNVPFYLYINKQTYLIKIYVN